jgi:hypothetical protein
MESNLRALSSILGKIILNSLFQPFKRTLIADQKKKTTGIKFSEMEDRFEENGK